MVVVIGRLPRHAVPEFTYRQLFVTEKSAKWMLVLWQHVLLGMYDVVLGLVTGILFYFILKQEFWVGIIQSVSYILGAGGGFISAKLLAKNAHAFWIGVLGLTFALLSFILMQNALGLWIFSIFSGFTSPFLNNQISSVWFKTMDNIPGNWISKFHLLLERDIALGLSRIFSLLILYLYLAHGNQVDLAKQWLIILPIMPIILGILLRQSGRSQPFCP